MCAKPLNLPDEKQRLPIKELAEEVRIKFGRKGLSDIFSILSDVGFLIRKPLDTREISGFSTFFENHFVVFTNSSFTLGHEIFTGAHELYHVIFNAETLRREKLIFNEEQNNQEDIKANIFASEFLMPENYVKETFYELVDVDKNHVLPRHIIIMHNHFRVSYKAMLKRLIQLGLCSVNNYEYLSDYGSLENADKLQLMTKKEGYSTELILPSQITYIPKKYIELVKVNYETGKISYRNMEKSLEFLGYSPADFGYEYPLEEDY